MAYKLPSLASLNPFDDSYKATNTYISAKENSILSELGKEGLSGFVFDVPETHKVTLSASTTDHYVEAGSAIHDHTTIKPVTIVISGFIGEVVHRKGSGISGIFSQISNKLTTVAAYTGGKTPQALQVAQEAAEKVRAVTAKAEALAANAASAISEVTSLLGFSAEPTKQQRAYAKLEILFHSKTLLTLLTPWRFYKNLAITALTFSQGEDSSQISNIKVSLKEVRKVPSITGYKDLADMLNREAIQSFPEVNGGQSDNPLLPLGLV